MSWLNYFYYFIIYSFIGWIVDTSYSSFKSKKFINRSFLTEPLSPIYGFSAIFIILTSYKFRDNLILFFIAATLISSSIEYFSSWFFEKFFNVKWWNYSKKRFNLSGRICLEYSIYWGMLAVLLINSFQPKIENMSIFLVNQLGIIGVILFLIILILDTYYTFGSFAKFKKFISQPLSEIKLNNKIKRLVKAFPKTKKLLQS